MIDLFAVQSSSSHPTVVTVGYTMILAFLLSGILALTYEKTFQGLSYSRNFLQSMVLSSLVTATIMQAIGDSIARGLGMMGALAIVRFRTNFKDSRDLMFLFAAIASGIACGVYAWGVAVGGTFSFIVVAWILSRTGFGSQRIFDGILRFTIGNSSAAKDSLESVFRTHLAHFAMVSLRDVSGMEGMVDCSYQIRMRQGHDAAALAQDLSKVPSVGSVQVLMQDTTQEL